MLVDKAIAWLEKTELLIGRIYGTHRGNRKGA